MHLTIGLLAAAVLETTSTLSLPPDVYLVIVDGLGRGRVSEATTPAIEALASRGVRFGNAVAVMPSVTNTNHVSLLTGAYPAAHGIVGNAVGDRARDGKSRGTDDPELLEVQTSFTRAAHREPALPTAAFFGKEKLGRLFARSEHQRGPDVVWTDRAMPSTPVDGTFGSDRRTMEAALATLATREDLRFVVIALADVDRVSHVFGPASDEARRAVLDADEQVSRLVRFLEKRGRWERSVVLVTSDHGFDDLTPGPDNAHPPVSLGRALEAAGLAEHLAVVSNGRLANVYLRGAPEAPAELEPATLALLRSARAILLRESAVEEVLFRAGGGAGPRPEPSLVESHPDWKLAHPAVGELVVLARPGHHFVDPFASWAAAMLGHHGSAHERPIPIVIGGGWAGIRPPKHDPAAAASAPDLGVTAQWLLCLGTTRTVDGRAVPAIFRGRRLAEAFRPSLAPPCAEPARPAESRSPNAPAPLAGP